MLENPASAPTGAGIKATRGSLLPWEAPPTPAFTPRAIATASLRDMICSRVSHGDVCCGCTFLRGRLESRENTLEPRLPQAAASLPPADSKPSDRPCVEDATQGSVQNTCWQKGSRWASYPTQLTEGGAVWAVAVDDTDHCIVTLGKSSTNEGESGGRTLRLVKC